MKIKHCSSSQIVTTVKKKKILQQYSDENEKLSSDFLFLSTKASLVLYVSALIGLSGPVVKELSTQQAHVWSEVQGSRYMSSADRIFGVERDKTHKIGSPFGNRCGVESLSREGYSAQDNI